jgi:hypothetical protein
MKVVTCIFLVSAQYTRALNTAVSTHRFYAFTEVSSPKQGGLR